MPLKIGCPNCRKVLIVGDEDPHWEFFCSECEIAMEVLGGRTADPGQQKSDAPRVSELYLTPAYPHLSRQWLEVCRGLKLAQIGHTICFIACIMGWPLFIAALVVWLAGPFWLISFEGFNVLSGLIALDGLAALVGLIFVAVGCWFCASAPRESEARGRAIAASICTSAGSLMGVVVPISMHWLDQTQVWYTVLPLAGPPLLLGMILSLLFISRVGRFFEEWSLSQSAIELLLFWIIAPLAVPVLVTIFSIVLLLLVLMVGMIFQFRLDHIDTSGALILAGILGGVGELSVPAIGSRMMVLLLRKTAALIMEKCRQA